jgi:WD40 repeat protein
MSSFSVQGWRAGWAGVGAVILWIATVDGFGDQPGGPAGSQTITATAQTEQTGSSPQQAAGSGAIAPAGVPEDPVVVEALEVLRDECVSCHRPGKAKGGLKLASLAAIRAGGESGPVLVPGKSGESLLVEVLAKDGDPHMPPKKQLSARQIEAVRAWVDAGGHWNAEVMERPPKVQPVALHPIPAGVKPMFAMAFSPDGTRLAVAKGGVIEIRDAQAAGFPLVRSIEAHVDPVQSMAWSLDGAFLVSGAFRAVRVWQVADGARVDELLDWVGDVAALRFSKEGSLLWVGDSIPTRAGFLAKLEWPGRKVLKRWKAHEDSILGLAIAGDGKSLVSGAADRLVRRWEVPSGVLMGTYEGHTNQVLSVAVNPETGRMASAGADREVKVWDMASREQEAVLGDKKQVYSAIAWSANGKALAGVTDRGNGTIFSDIQRNGGEFGDARSEKSKTLALQKVDAFLQSVAVSADGGWIAAGSAEGRLFVWKGADGKLVALSEPVAVPASAPNPNPAPTPAPAQSATSAPSKTP